MPAKKPDPDAIRDAVIAAKDRLGLSAREIALSADADNITVGHVQRYIAGTSDMSGKRLQHVLRVLGIELKTQEDNS